MKSNSEQIKRLQTLRFIAASMVVVRHTYMELDQHGVPVAGQAALSAFPWGAGVDIFFVISGFIIFYGSGGREPSIRGSGAFFLRRLVRLWPIYAIFTSLMLTVQLVSPGTLKHAGLSTTHVLASLAFIPWPRPGDGAYYPLLGQGWTLNYEMFFYTAFALVLLAPTRARAWILFAGGALLVTAGTFSSLPQPLAYYANPIVAEFLFGVALSLAYRRIPSLSLSTTAVLSVSALACLYALPTLAPGLPRALAAGIPATALVAAVLFSGAQGEVLIGTRFLSLLGDASYALYLCHPFVVNALLLGWLATVGDVGQWAFLAFAVLLSTVASLLVYVVLERPMLAFLNRILLTPKTTSANAT